MFHDIGHEAFMLGVSGLLVLAVAWLIRRDRVNLCPASLILPFLFLAILALDGGLFRLLRIVGLVARMGEAWPPIGPWQAWYRAVSLVLAVVFAAWALWVLIRARFPLRLTVATSLVAAVALVRGLESVRWVKAWRVAGVFTSHPLDGPWMAIWAAAPGVFVVTAVVLVLWTSRRKNGSEARPVLGDRCPEEGITQLPHHDRPTEGANG
ncbi:MAG TPA: hypothetical protein PLL20_09635 [Phycisphaerae bacterium]|nr:hypothetical protein [Phycisphaerae bacterium]HRR86340.1 hypothetical protein [Phycisphaerae bacterium]